MTTAVSPVSIRPPRLDRGPRQRGRTRLGVTTAAVLSVAALAGCGHTVSGHSAPTSSPPPSHPVDACTLAGPLPASAMQSISAVAARHTRARGCLTVTGVVECVRPQADSSLFVRLRLPVTAGVPTGPDVAGCAPPAGAGRRYIDLFLLPGIDDQGYSQESDGQQFRYAPTDIAPVGAQLEVSGRLFRRAVPHAPPSALILLAQRVTILNAAGQPAYDYRGVG